MIKHLFITALFIPMAGWAQILSVGSTEKIEVPSETPVVAAISPKGDFLLLTNSVCDGLVKFDLSSHQATQLTDADGAGYNVRLSATGNAVVYREISLDKNHLRRVALHSLNLVNGKKKKLVKASRNLQGYSVSGEQASFVNNGKKAVKALASGVKKTDLPTFSIDNQQLMITRNGKTSVFSPNGTDKSYIWPELSPDGSKVVYYVASIGAFVCNIDGTQIVPLGIIRAPKWFDNNTVVGMKDEDDGECIYASTVVAATLDGKRQKLTSDSIIAMFPQPSAASGKISFSTPKGETYIMNVSKNAEQ